MRTCVSASGFLPQIHTCKTSLKHPPTQSTQILISVTNVALLSASCSAPNEPQTFCPRITNILNSMDENSFRGSGYRQTVRFSHQVKLLTWPCVRKQNTPDKQSRRFVWFEWLPIKITLHLANNRKQTESKSISCVSVFSMRRMIDISKLLQTGFKPAGGVDCFFLSCTL